MRMGLDDEQVLLFMGDSVTDCGREQDTDRHLDCLVVETLTIVLSFGLTFSRTRSTVEAGRTSLQALMRKASTSRKATRLAFAASI